ncbi:MAG: hypothetical protein M1829_001363 [Trizodia sp. TS-e1964]|nr:MAG: hypothetical protein M1829_001363 [Trizodia sp. TS-e1964]
MATTTATTTVAANTAAISIPNSSYCSFHSEPCYSSMPNSTPSKTANSPNIIRLSTPLKAQSSTDPGSNARLRADSILQNLVVENKIFVEEADVNNSMIQTFLKGIESERQEAFNKTIQKLLTPEALGQLQKFLDSSNSGTSNETEFKMFLHYITLIVKSSENMNIRYIHSGSQGLAEPNSAWIHPMERITSNSLLLRPDFYTVHLDTVQLEGMSKTNKVVIDAYPFKDNISWEDIRVLWELKSNTSTINSDADIANILLKASQALRFQPCRSFFVAFLLCGTKFRIVRVDRLGVLLGQPIQLSLEKEQIDRDSASLFLQCIVASLVFSDQAIGNLPLLDAPLGKSPILTVPLSSNSQQYELGSQITGPRANLICTRGTTVYMAREYPLPDGYDITSWPYCLKLSWAYDDRDHEGIVLQNLSGIEGLAGLQAWHVVPNTAFDANFKHFFLPYPARHKDFTSQMDGLVLSSSPKKIHDPKIRREPRVVVMDFVSNDFNTSRRLVDVLRAWRQLFAIIGNLGLVNWAHKDLSFTNVRLTDDGNVKLVDFDLARQIPTTKAKSVDRTGTPAFQALEILKGNFKEDFSYNLMHELESAFWIGYLALLHLGKKAEETGTEDIIRLIYENNKTPRTVGAEKGDHLKDYNDRENYIRSIPNQTKENLETIVTLCDRIADALLLAPNSSRPSSNYGSCSRDNIKAWSSQVLEVAKRELTEAISSLELRRG